MPKNPEIAIETNNAGQKFIGATYFDENGYGVRSSVLAWKPDFVCDEVFERQYQDIIALRDGTVTA